MPVRDNQPPRQPAAPAERDGFTPPTLYTARGAEQPLPQVNGTRQLPPPPQVNGTRQAGAPRPRPAKADPLPLRVAFGLGGIAAAAGLFATIATSAIPAAASVADANQADSGQQASYTGTNTSSNGTGSTGSTGSTTSQGSASSNGSSSSRGTSPSNPSVGVQVPAATPRPRRVGIVSRQSGAR